jgi:hypothetical protein
MNESQQSKITYSDAAGSAFVVCAIASHEVPRRAELRRPLFIGKFIADDLWKLEL